MIILQSLEELLGDSVKNNTKIKACLLLTIATTPAYNATLWILNAHYAKLEQVYNQPFTINEHWHKYNELSHDQCNKGIPISSKRG